MTSLKPAYAYVDQVPRREEFEKAHPEVVIEVDGDAWKATWPGKWSEPTVIYNYTLEGLLDKLASIFPDWES
jgi:hypothetical protein